jgi:phospholipase/carboxylesterase
MLLRIAILAFSLVVAGCTGDDDRDMATGSAHRLTAAPGAGDGRCTIGVHELAVGKGLKARMQVTPRAATGRRALILALHGAGGASNDGLYAFRGAWDIPGLVLVAPSSQGSTWSFLRGTDVDAETVNRSLARAFARCPVDRRRVAVGGFSDGATYALSLGLDNGNLFKAIMALSPGGAITRHPVGKPRIFISHGTRDNVLPFARTRDELVPELRAAGYSVTLRTFAGGHKAPAAMSRAAVRWFLGR